EAGVEQSAVLLALSQLLLGMGEEAKGRQLMDQALSLVASHPSEPLLDDLLENAGDMYYGMEMWEESIKMYKRAVNVQRELAGGMGRGGEHYLQASTLCSLANALMAAQRHEEAEEVLDGLPCLRVTLILSTLHHSLFPRGRALPASIHSLQPRECINGGAEARRGGGGAEASGRAV
ncbi:unnamed protein product, partial [Closterium sp. NIES-54]